MAWRMRARNCSLLIRVRPTPTTAKGSGRTRPWNIDQRAGTSLRRVRSPEAPKMTSVQDSSPAGLTISTCRSEAPRRRPSNLQELLQSLGGLAREAEADDPAALLAQGLEIAQGLCGLERREPVVGSRDGEVVLVLAHDLDEQPVRTAALVELAGGVQVLWAEGDRGGDAQAVAQEHAKRLEPVPVVGRRRKVGEKRDVVVGLRLGEVRGEPFAHRRDR